jgi:hypothetical protein
MCLPSHAKPRLHTLTPLSSQLPCHACPLQIIYTIDNSSDSTTEWRDDAGREHSLWTEPNSLLAVEVSQLQGSWRGLEGGLRAARARPPPGPPPPPPRPPPPQGCRACVVTVQYTCLPGVGQQPSTLMLCSMVLVVAAPNLSCLCCCCCCCCWTHAAG